MHAACEELDREGLEPLGRRAPDPARPPWLEEPIPEASPAGARSVGRSEHRAGPGDARRPESGRGRARGGIWTAAYGLARAARVRRGRLPAETAHRPSWRRRGGWRPTASSRCSRPRTSGCRPRPRGPRTSSFDRSGRLTGRRPNCAAGWRASCGGCGAPWTRSPVRPSTRPAPQRRRPGGRARTGRDACVPSGTSAVEGWTGRGGAADERRGGAAGGASSCARAVARPARHLSPAQRRERLTRTRAAPGSAAGLAARIQRRAASGCRPVEGGRRAGLQPAPAAWPRQS